MSEPYDIVVERISYRIFSIRGGKLLKTWAKVGSRLKPVTATTEAGLRKKLRQISVNILNGRTEAAELEDHDHRAYLAARTIAKARGLSVETAVREYDAVCAILGTVSPLEAARFYQVHAGTVEGIRTVHQVIEEFKPSLLKQSAAYREIFGYDLDRLDRALGSRPIGEITRKDLQKIINETGKVIGGKIRPASEWRRKQVRGELVTFFNFAKAEGYLPKQLAHVAQGLARIKPIIEARKVWDPEHLRRALEVVSADDRPWLPWLAICCLLNVRSGGTRRLEFQDIHWQDNLLELIASRSKVKSRVTVTMKPTLLSWIDTFRGKTGPVCPAKGFGSFIERLRKKYALPYYRNIHRKSYITYLLALTDDEEYVATVANTSVKKLRDNYRQIHTFAGRLVTKELAEAWFGTARIAAENVVQLEFGS